MTTTVTTRPARTTRRRQATRARLLDAAFAVFAARGFGQVRIEEVCEAAGYTRGAFYSNFASLDELFFALYEQHGAAVAEQVATALAQAHGEPVTTVVDRVVAAFPVDRDWELVRTEFALHAARHPQVAQALVAHRAALREALASVLGPAVDPARLPPSLREPAALARAVTAVHDGVMAELLLDDDPGLARSRLRDLLSALLDPGAGQRAGSGAAPGGAEPAAQRATTDRRSP